MRSAHKGQLLIYSKRGLCMHRGLLTALLVQCCYSAVYVLDHIRLRVKRRIINNH